MTLKLSDEFWSDEEETFVDSEQTRETILKCFKCKWEGLCYTPYIPNCKHFELKTNQEN